MISGIPCTVEARELKYDCPLNCQSLEKKEENMHRSSQAHIPTLRRLLHTCEILLFIWLFWPLKEQLEVPPTPSPSEQGAKREIGMKLEKRMMKLKKPGLQACGFGVSPFWGDLRAHPT